MNYRFKPGDKVTVRKIWRHMKRIICYLEKPHVMPLLLLILWKIFEGNKSQSRTMIVVGVQCVTG